MNELQKVFNYEDHQVRTVIKDGEPWFVAKDVCEILGLTDVSKSLERLDEDEKGTNIIRTHGGPQQMSVVNEYGLYRLIFTSRKEEAEKFKRWLAHDVLPTIRKTGGYVADDEVFIKTYLPFADEQTKSTFRATLAIVRKQNEQIALMKPKADYFDALVERNLLTNFRDTAKELKVGQNWFINWLFEKKYIYRDQKGKIKPYSQFTPDLFELKEWVRNGKADTQTLITPKGRETFRLMIESEKGVKENAIVVNP